MHNPSEHAQIADAFYNQITDHALALNSRGVHHVEVEPQAGQVVLVINSPGKPTIINEYGVDMCEMQRAARDLLSAVSSPIIQKELSA